MRYLLPLRSWPLNFFQIYGVVCCQNMLLEFEKLRFMEFLLCYEAKSVYEANVFVVWGSVSQKLADLVADQIEEMNTIKCLLHMRGCDNRIDNAIASSSLSSILPVSSVFSECRMNKSDYQKLIIEARKCLRA